MSHNTDESRTLPESSSLAIEGPDPLVGEVIEIPITDGDAENGERDIDNAASDYIRHVRDRLANENQQDDA